MKIAIVSTIRKACGGSEELWTAFALKALECGHSLVVSAFDCGEISPKSKDLISKGVVYDWRIGEISKKLPWWDFFLMRAKRIYRKKYFRKTKGRRCKKKAGRI